MNKAATPLSSLSLASNCDAIIVRVARIWESVNTNTNEVFGLNMQLLDEEGSEMQVNIGPKIFSLFQRQIEEGKIYSIQNFDVIPAVQDYLTVHKDIMIKFHACTKVDAAEIQDIAIPKYKFSITDYEDVKQRVDLTKHLTDVFGVLRNVGVVDEVIKRNGDPTMKRDIFIELSCGNRIKATLWGNKTTLLDRVNTTGSLTTIVFTSGVVRRFLGTPSLTSTSATRVYLNAEMENTEEFFNRLKKRKAAEIDMEPITIAKKAVHVEQKTLAEVLVADGREFDEGKKYMFPAKITAVINQFGWKYLSCKICKSGVSKAGLTHWCKKCNSETTSPMYRYRLEMEVQDHTTSAQIVAFDKEAELLLNKNITSMIAIEEKENGDSEIDKLFKGLIGREAMFHVKSTNYRAAGGAVKLTAYKIHNKIKEEPAVSPLACTETVATSNSKNTDGSETSGTKK